MKIKYTLFVIGMIMTIVPSSIQAQTRATDAVGGIIGQERQIQEAERLRRIIRRERRTATEKEQKVLDVAPEDEESVRVLIEKIIVNGVTLVPEYRVIQTAQRYRGMKLSLREMRAVTAEITALYRKQGYVTSRAYMPPQNLQDGVLEIEVAEGKMGNLTIQGNKHFSDRTLAKKFKMSSGEIFDYSELQKSLSYINEHPDRTATASLLPGEFAKTTDLVVDVQDQRPFHVGIEYDNYLSRYLKEDRFSLFLEHNNLTGHDDRLYLKGQLSQDGLLNSQYLRYIYPVTRSLEIGAYGVHTETELAKEFEPLQAEGDAWIYGVFASKDVIKNQDMQLRFNMGLDIKDIENSLLGSTVSHDELSILKAGFEWDVADPWGRTIFTADMHYGFPDFLGSMDAKDPNASRLGAGGKFQKGVMNFFRLQPMMYESTILWKNSGQFSNHNLVSSEQFQIGGPYSVRGYAPAEFTGDRGIYSAVEWSFPVYGLSRRVAVPFRQERLYDALRLVTFYDWAFSKTKSVAVGERETNTLQGWGAGARINLSDDMALRAEVGFPISGKSVDGDHAHTWIEFLLRY